MGDTIGAGEIHSLGVFLRDSGKDILAAASTNLYYLNSTTWDTLDTGFTGNDLAIEAVQVDGKVFFASEDDTLHYWDRLLTTLNASLTDLGAAIPHGNDMIWHKNHLFHLNNVNVSGNKYAHRLYWSTMDDPTTYDTTNDYFEVPGDGRLITAVDQGEYLVLFKERAVQFLQGWGDTSWRVTASSSNVSNIDERVGIAGKRAATKVGDEVWFMDNEGQIRRLYRTSFDTFRRDIVSSKIQGTLDGINDNRLDQVVAWTAGDKVFFAVPDGTSTTNDLVLVYDLIASKRTNSEAWTTYTGWTVGDFASYPTSDTMQLYIGDGSTGKIYKHEGSDDDGTAIDSRWDSKEDSFEDDERYKRYKFGYVTAESSGADVDIAIHASVDGAPFADLGDINLAGSGSRLGPTGSFLLGPTGGATLGGETVAEKKFYYTTGGGTARGKRLMHSIRHNAAGEDASVNTFTSHFKLRTLR